MMRVGLYDWERTEDFRQPVQVSVCLYADPDYLKKASPDNLIDYGAIGAYIESWSARPHTALVETLMADLLAACFKNPLVTAVKATISKPDILPQAGGAGLEIFINRETFLNF